MQLRKGIKSLAVFLDLPERKTYYLASKGHISGVFKMAKDYVWDPEIVIEGLKDRARAGVKAPPKNGERR